MSFRIALPRRARLPLAGRRMPFWAAMAGCAILACLILAALMATRGWQLRRSLVLADPDSILARPALASFAEIAGQSVFSVHCAQCHGARGKGDPTLGVPDLTDTDFLYGEGRVSEIEDIVQHGIRAGDRRGRNFAFMPAYASERPYAAEPIPPLTPPETRDVVQTLLAFTGRSTDAGAAERGRALFLGKGGCYDCHGGDAKGDPAIGAPNLTDGIWLYGDGSATAIASAIEFGRKGYSPAYARVLTAAQSREVAVFVAALSHPTPARLAGSTRMPGP